MAASVRISSIQAASQRPVSVSKWTSNGTRSHGPVVRIADITAKGTGTVVRISDITAVNGVSNATVRITRVTAYSVQDQQLWDGTKWIKAPSASGHSAWHWRSAGTGAAQFGGSGQSRWFSRSAGSGILTRSVTVSLSSTGVLTASAAKNPNPVNGVATVNLTGGGTLSVQLAQIGGLTGAPALTAIPDPTNLPPRILLELNNGGSTEATIVRIDQAGNRTPVRLANPATLNSGDWVGFDYEAPYDQPVSYESTSAQATLDSGQVTLQVDAPWLVHPGIPARSVPLVIASIGARTRPTLQGIHQPVGRDTAIVITDGIRRQPTFDLVVRTVDEAARGDLLAILSDTTPLLLQVTYPATTRTDYMWVAVGDLTETPMVDEDYGNLAIAWTLPCTVTTPPTGLQQSQWTWADLIAAYDTWADVLAAFNTWADVIIDAPIGS
jgi:hypothetical protein